MDILIVNSVDDEIGIEFTTSKLPLTLNRLLGADRRFLQGYRRSWSEAMANLPTRRTKPDRKALVTICIYWNSKRNYLDKCNRYGAVKALEDQLVDRNWLRDDSDKWCDLSVFNGHFKQLKGVPGGLIYPHTYVRVQY